MGKVVAVQKWEKPNTITGLRAFLGFANYYSAYVRDYAGIVSPMMELLKVGRLERKKGSTTSRGRLRQTWPLWQPKKPLVGS